MSKKLKRGRPRLSSEKRRSETVRVRLTVDESVRWENHAYAIGCSSVSQMIRQLVSGSIIGLELADEAADTMFGAEGA